MPENNSSNALPIMAILGNIGNVISQALTNKQNRVQQEKINALNYKMFKENQAYYSPANQAKLLQAAGLNKVLAVQGLSSGKAISSPQMDVYRAEAPQLDSEAFSGMAEYLLQKKQVESNIQVQEEQKNNLKAQNLKTLAETANLQFDVELKKAMRSGNIELLNKTIEEKTNLIEKVQTEIQNMIEDIKTKSEMRPLQIEKLRTDIDMQKEQIQKIIQETENETLKHSLIQEQTKGEQLDNYFQSIINGYQEEKSQKELKLLDVQFQKADQEIKKLISETKNVDIKNYLDNIRLKYETEYIQAQIRSLNMMSKEKQYIILNRIFEAFKPNTSGLPIPLPAK